MNPSAPPGDGYLKVERLAKHFGDTVAVDEVSLSIGKGEIFALLGSSGCGKSTLLRMLAGFERPSAGTVILNGADIGHLAPYERPINMMFQSYALFPHLSVWDNIAFGLKRQGMPKAQIHARVAEMLDLVQLAAQAKRKPHQLSGGQQQRVALARSLARKPQLLLLDEPMAALDRKLRERTQFELVTILESVGVTCVMVTHDQEEAMTMATRIAVMSQGRVLQVGTPREIYERPGGRFVADFIGSVNIFDGNVASVDARGCDVVTGTGVMRVGHGCAGGDVAVGMAAAVAVRPEKIQLARQRPAVEHNLFGGVVREIAYFGSYNTFMVEMPGGRAVKITGSNAAPHGAGLGAGIARGDSVFFWWDDSAPVLLTR